MSSNRSLELVIGNVTGQVCICINDLIIPDDTFVDKPLKLCFKATWILLSLTPYFANITGRSDWDDGRWEWEDTPRRDGYSNSSRRHQPSRSPMLLGASPDARLVSPWLGGNTPHSSGMLFRHAAYLSKSNLDGYDLPFCKSLVITYLEVQQVLLLLPGITYLHLPFQYVHPDTHPNLQV